MIAELVKAISSSCTACKLESRLLSKVQERWESFLQQFPSNIGEKEIEVLSMIILGHHKDPIALTYFPLPDAQLAVA